MIYYKVLNVDGRPFYGGAGRWHLPQADGPGEWMPTIPDPVPCKRGYHLCRDAADLLEWLGPTIWVAEVDGAVIAHHNKAVVGRARLLRRLPWDEQTARQFAADCAARALPVYEAACPGDDRARRAVEATRDELSAAAAFWAAGAAAWAAEAAAGDAARSAGAAARAARAVAWAAAGGDEDAEDAERRWQAARLAELLGIAPGGAR